MRVAPMLRDLAWVEEDMKLPEGKTCGDCAQFSRCAALIAQIEKDEVCDWSPSRFREKAQQGEAVSVAANSCH